MGQSLTGTGDQERFFLQKVKLGQGTFGIVWRAVDRDSNAIVAVKQLDKAVLSARGARREDVEREVTVMQAVRHENVIQILGHWEDSQSIFLALEYSDGGDFGDKVRYKGMDLTEAEAAGWTFQMISAISALHEQFICHRDIKCDNFMVHGEVVKLADFGLALKLPRGQLLTDKCGTPAFMAPEQHRLPRSRGYDHSCDVWAAGVTMYMLMFGGRHPFLKRGGQSLDEAALLHGKLDFAVSQGIFGFGGESRYSESARSLCSRMVCPETSQRLTAVDALHDTWFKEMRVGLREQVKPSEPSEAQRKPPAAPREELTAAGGASSGSPPSGPSEEELYRQIQELESQLRLQKEHNESQWDVLVHNNQMMQKLLIDRQVAATQAAQAVQPPVQPPERSAATRRSTLQAWSLCKA